jgi:hypothetical protein
MAKKSKRNNIEMHSDELDPLFDMSTPEDIFLARGFRGSKKLKRAGEPVEWTEERMKEYARCEKDPIYFCRKYIKIVNVDEGLIPFKPHDFQLEMIGSMWKNRNTIITTARQIGKSTVTCAFIVWYIIFHSNKSVALLANKGDTAREIMGKVHLAYENLPKWLQQGVVNANKGSLELENGSRCLATATSGSAIRGYSVNLLFIDEAAFVEDWDTFFTAVMPTISSGKTTKIVLVSTPNGLNHYYKLWKFAGGIKPEEKKNSYHPIKVVWSQVPGRDEEWKQKTLADLNFDEEKFAQENECEFLGSSGTLISGKALKELAMDIPLNEANGLRQYERPDKDKSYVIVCDTSKGKKLDYSAFSVIDVTKMPYRQVCTFYSNEVPPQEYAEIIHNIAKAYYTPMILVENNNMGQTVVDTLWYEFEYENLLCTTTGGGRTGKQITIGGASKHVQMGVMTTSPIKAKGCSMLKLLIEQKQLIVTDEHTIHELSVFSKKGQSYEAEPGEHDDLVMTLVLFGWLTDQKYFKELTDINTVREIRDQREEDLENEMIPFGFIVPSADHFDDKVDPFRPISQPHEALFNDRAGHDKAAIDQMLNDDNFMQFLLNNTNIRN